MKALVGFVLAGGLLLGVLSGFVDRVLFQPSPGVDITPEALGISAESLFLETRDGVRVHAFYLPGAPRRDRALLFLHGNAGNASHRLPNAAQLARLGSDVLLLDYRGYGLSEGTPSEAGTAEDARAALAHLTTERGFAPERIVLFGRSLGGAVAVELAQDRPLAGVILESTFTSVADMARTLLGPLGAAIRGFPSDERVGQLRAPLLSFHGDRDEIVPFALGQRLFEVAPEPKSFETIVGAGHNDTVEVGGAPYFARIERFLDAVAPPATPGEAKPNEAPE
ncbi:MAG: alpha/beta fold hydrolase [Myxococcota bacterium]